MGIMPVRSSLSRQRRTRLYHACHLRQWVLLLPVMALVGVGLTACGQKGPLYQPPAKTAPVNAPATTPASPDDAATDAPRKGAAERSDDEPHANGIAPE